MKKVWFMMVLAIGFGASVSEAYVRGCTTDVTTASDQIGGIQKRNGKGPRGETVTKVCICGSERHPKVRIHLDSTRRGPEVVTYRVNKMKQEFFAGLEEVYLDVTGEGYTYPGLLNFFLGCTRDGMVECSGDLNILRGVMWRGVRFTADFGSEASSCSRYDAPDAK